MSAWRERREYNKINLRYYYLQDQPNFLDTGLCAYLTEWSNPETLEAGAMSGAILETFILLGRVGIEPTTR